MTNELLRRSRIVIVCGVIDSDNVFEDIALAQKYHIPITSLDRIIVCELKRKKSDLK